MRSRHRWVVVSAVACVGIAAAATAVTLYRDHPSNARPAAAANTVHGPPRHAAHVVSEARGHVRCPRGSVPNVYIYDAWFHPRLYHGADFLRGTYRIRLHGRVRNETSAPIRITGIHPWVQHRTWRHARVVGPSRLPAHSSRRLVIVGLFHNRRPVDAAVGARLSWQWLRPSLRTCGKQGLSPTSFAVTNTDPTIVAAGDIACRQGSAPTATSCQQMATSNLAVSLKPNYVLPLGDDQYELGSLSDFKAGYGPSWGRLNSIAHPVPGNHDYGFIGTAVEPTGGKGYFTYFGDRSHPLQPSCKVSCKSWYSYNIGSWHVVALDSQCAVIGGCNPGNPEYDWLQADLKANPAKCTLAYWHIPLFSSSQDHQPDMQAIYDLLYSKGADVVLNGHGHFYERFAPQDASGNATANGPREFVVGTGGRNFFHIRSTPAANSQARIANTFGVLQMTLSNGSYSWRFVPTAGGTATDSGSAACV